MICVRLSDFEEASEDCKWTNDLRARAFVPNRTPQSCSSPCRSGLLESNTKQETS